MMNRTDLRSVRGDDGFTLVELLVAIVIMGVISVPLTNVVISYLHNSDATMARLLESHDVQISSAYWAQDVASIGTRSTTSLYPLTQSVETDVAYSASKYPCGPAGTTPIVTLAWDDFTGPGTSTLVRVAYVRKAAPGQTALTELHRLRCDGTAPGFSDVTLAHDLNPSPPLTPATVVCSTTCMGTHDMPVPTTITLNLSLKDPKDPGEAYSIPLIGQRRQS